MDKKKLLKFGAIGIICLALIGVSIKLFLGNKNQTTNTPQFASVEVQKGNIQVTASGSGNIAASVRKEIVALNNGIVDNIFAAEGQNVKEGDLILTFESNTENTALERSKLDLSIQENSLQDLETEQKNLKVYAPASGFISDIKGTIGGELSKGSSLATIDDTSKMEVTASFNAAQIKDVSVGDKASVLLVNSMQTVSGTVSKVNKAPSASDGAALYGVTVEVSNPGGLNTGDSVQVTVSNKKGTFPGVGNAALRSKTPINVKLLAGGTVTKLPIAAGDYVQKGQLLAEMQSTDLQTQIQTQRMKVEQNQADLNEQLSNLDNAAVYAPISGVITSINVTAGENVRESTAVAVVSDLKNLEVVIPVDELDVTKVKVGQEAAVTVDAMPEQKFSASVAKIALEGTATGGVTTFNVTLALKDAEGLKPGMTANAEIIAQQKQNVLLLPVEAVQQRGNNKFVFTGDEKSASQGKPTMTPIKVGLVSEDYVEIVDGLKAGDTVLYPRISSTNSQNQNQQRGAGGFGMMGAGGVRPSGGGGRTGGNSGNRGDN